MTAKSSPTVTPFKGVNKGGRCPICRKPAVTDYRPFCSKRCSDVDLGQWLAEGYRLPSDEPVDPEELVAALEQEDTE